MLVPVVPNWLKPNCVCGASSAERQARSLSTGEIHRQGRAVETVAGLPGEIGEIDDIAELQAGDGAGEIQTRTNAGRVDLKGLAGR